MYSRARKTYRDETFQGSDSVVYDGTSRRVAKSRGLTETVTCCHLAASSTIKLAQK